MAISTIPKIEYAEYYRPKLVCTLPADIVQLLTSFLELPRLEQLITGHAATSLDYLEFNIPHEEFRETFSADNDLMSLLISDWCCVGDGAFTISVELIGYLGDEGEDRITIERFECVPMISNFHEREVYLTALYLNRVLTDAEGALERMRPATCDEIAQALGSLRVPPEPMQLPIVIEHQLTSAENMQFNDAQQNATEFISSLCMIAQEEKSRDPGSELRRNHDTDTRLTQNDPVQMAICDQFNEEERQAFDNIMPAIRAAVDQAMRPQEEEKSAIASGDWPFTDHKHFEVLNRRVYGLKLGPPGF